MEIKDSLTLYNELKACGVPEDQAQVQASQLGGVKDVVVGIKEIITKIEKDLLWMRIIGAAMTVTFFSNGFFMWLSK